MFQVLKISHISRIMYPFVCSSNKLMFRQHAASMYGFVPDSIRGPVRPPVRMPACLSVRSS